jgi:chaperonin GroES
MEEAGSQATSPVQSLVAKIDKANIAKELDKDLITKIGTEAKQGFDADEESRKPWLEDTKDWLDLAKQVRDKKTFPWEGASNVKYPLISTAAMQFSARCYPSLIPGDGNIVKTRIIGKDLDGEKAKKGERVGKFMSWQLLYDMPRWEEDMDRMFMIQAVVGNTFKKTYFDKITEKPCSELVYVENFVVDYWATDLESSERYSEIFYLTPRKVKEKTASEEFLDVDLGPPPMPEGTNSPVSLDPVLPYKLIQQATWLDLDDDGIKEPYTVVFHYESAKVLKIIARFTPKDIVLNDKKEIVAIKDSCYYTKYGFIPNPDGSFYDLGFGHLLGPINEAVNTIVNQLVDAGHLANLQAGFVGKGLRLKMGDSPLKPGEWRAVNAIGDDLRKQMIPLPVKEPSTVLFQLLGMLITSGKELASVAEIFVGKMPGQNTPATTTMASIEQGMKVFTAIYKRIFRSLDKEFKKLFNINKNFLDPNVYSAVIDDTIGPDDFNTDLYDICPAADPQASTQTEKLAKAQALLELLPLGTIDPVVATMRILQAQEQPNWEQLIPGMAETGQPQIPQREDPKMQEMQQKMNLEQQKAGLNMQMTQQKMAMDQQSDEAKLAMKSQEHRMDMQAKAEQQGIDAQIARDKQQIFMRDAAVQSKAKEIGAAQDLQAKDMSHKQKLQQQKETAKSKPQEKSGKSGKTTQSPKQSKKK